MNVLRLFLTDQVISRKNLFIAIGALTWFGIAANGLFELWKLLPTLFLPGPLVPDWQSLFLYLFPAISFLAVILFYLYPKIQSVITPSSVVTSVREDVLPHRGIILALSKPTNMNPEKIADDIRSAKDPSELYQMWSIGQLFRGIHFHSPTLKYVWILTTDESKPFLECAEVFVGRFLPGVHICKEGSLCHLEPKTEIEMIEMTKAKLYHIFSLENLNTLALQRSDIIVDVTGGTKAITIGLTFGALDSATDIQYVEQKTHNVIPLGITPEIVLDKMGEYLVELHAKVKKGKERS